jgi:hypothetical protein
MTEFHYKGPAIGHALAASFAQAHEGVASACRRRPMDLEPEPRVVYYPPYKSVQPSGGYDAVEEYTGKERRARTVVAVDASSDWRFGGTPTGRVSYSLPVLQEISRDNPARAEAARILQSGQNIGLTEQQAKAHGVLGKALEQGLSPGEALFYATTGHPCAVWLRMSFSERGTWEYKAILSGGVPNV